MKKMLRCALVGTTLGATLFAACDAAPPPKAASPSVAPATIPASETIVEVTRVALANIVRDRDSYSRARRLGTLLPTMAPESVPAVIQTLEDRRVDLRATEIELLTRFWATHEPEVASRWAINESSLNYRAVAVFAALSTWASMDPQTAVKVAWEWVDLTTLESIVPISLVRGWYAANQPEELRQYLRSIPPDIIGQRAVAAYIRVLIEAEGFEAAKRYAESLPGGEENKGFNLTVYRRVADARAQRDVEAAVVWCERHCNGPYGNNMRNIIARNWVYLDAPAALMWLSTMPPGSERNVAVRVAFASWTRIDREAALAWMATQTAGEPAPWLRATYPVYARLISEDSPLDAIKWAEQIENPYERDQVLFGVVRVWRQRDEAAAESWLLQSSLSEEDRAKVRAPAEDLSPNAG
jgi:hypothetical protein